MSGMQLRNITLIASFMTVSLLGVIGLQGYWLKQTIDQAAEEFDQRAERALFATVSNLKQSEVELLINEEFEEVFDMRTLIRDSIPQYTTEFVYEVGEPGEVEVIVNAGGKTLSEDHRSVIIIESDTTNIFREFEKVEQEFEVLEQAFKTVLVRQLTAEEDLYRRLENVEIQPLINDELQKEGIDLPFDYAITTDSVLAQFSSSVEIDNMEYAVDIFRSEEDSPILHLGFATKGAYILKNTGSVLGLVTLFTLLMLGTTIYAIRFMLSQKRLADMKSDFINNMTHEFKTPLATIGLAADSIRHPRVRGNETELDRYSDIIAKESKRLNSHVESILHLAKMERGEIRLKKVRVKINDLLREAIAANRLRIEQSGANLTEDFLENDAECLVDPYHVGNALSNLIDNAIKYSKENPVIGISVKREAGFIHFKVTDKGIGMSEEAKKRAFEAFYREQTGNLHDVKGFGVGLSYVKEIAEEHGGSANLESKKGKGTTVTIKIPCDES